MAIACRAVLLDIEGTVSPVAFVFDVMFPYVRTNLRPFLQQHLQTESVHQALELMAADAGHESWADWGGQLEEFAQIELIAQAVIGWMDTDAKLTGLKQLQGLIWRDGFESGELVATLFEDVADQLRRWEQSALELYIYSSGSVGAQKLFFGHTDHGDLLHLFSGHFDTTTGNKKQPESYRKIAETINAPAGQILFISDIVAELDAARSAGMLTILRPDGEPPAGCDHPCINSFTEIELVHSQMAGK